MFVAIGYAVLAVLVLGLFFISRRLVVTRLAIRMTLLMLVAGFAVLTAGGALMGYLQQHNKIDTQTTGLISVISLVAAVGGVTLTGWQFVRWVRSKTPPLEANQFD